MGKQNITVAEKRSCDSIFFETTENKYLMTGDKKMYTKEIFENFLEETKDRKINGIYNPTNVSDEKEVMIYLYLETEYTKSEDCFEETERFNIKLLGNTLIIIQETDEEILNENKEKYDKTGKTIQQIHYIPYSEIKEFYYNMQKK